MARAAVATLAATLAVARAAMAMVEKTRACGMAAVGLEVWRRLRRGGVRLVAAYSRALLAVKRELRNGAELSGMRVIVRSFFTVLPRTGHLFFRAPPNKKDPAISSACGGENVQSLIKEAFSMTIGVTGQGTCDQYLVLNSSCQAQEQRVRPAAHSALS